MNNLTDNIEHKDTKDFIYKKLPVILFFPLNFSPRNVVGFRYAQLLFAIFLTFNFQLLTFNCTAQVLDIYTFAGNGINGYSGDGGPDTTAELSDPWGLARDGKGNIYIGDNGNNRVRMINTSGVISTVAGTGKYGFSGDGGAATAAEISAPRGVAVDASGNIYIADYSNNRIRKVNTSGTISTVAGNGIAGYSGDGAAATAAQLYYPPGVAVDGAGNIYIAAGQMNRIRVVNTSGIINTIAGDGTAGYSGDGGSAITAELYNPQGVTPDASGNIYIADYGNNRVRKVNTAGNISTVAGTGKAGYNGDGGAATAAELYNPTGVTIDSAGDIYIADNNNSRVRKVSTTGIISTVAGDSNTGYSGNGGLATMAELNGPTSILLNSGIIYIADQDNSCIREVKKAPPPLAVNELSNAMDVTVYPNPGDGRFQLRITNYESGITNSVEVYNMLGEKVYSTLANSHQPRYFGANSQFSIDLSNLSNGIYILRIISGQSAICKKIEIHK
ncbi:MAG: T9SS type A sorting domain-containing protein [Bacteroidia bacterium]